MAIDNETVKRIAFLSRLKVNDDKIEATNTDNVEPLISVNDTTLRLREDEITDGNYQEAVLANAPDKEYDYFAVPKVVE